MDLPLARTADGSVRELLEQLTTLSGRMQATLEGIPVGLSVAQAAERLRSSRG